MFLRGLFYLLDLYFNFLICAIYALIGVSSIIAKSLKIIEKNYLRWFSLHNSPVRNRREGVSNNFLCVRGMEEGKVDLEKKLKVNSKM